MWSTEVLTLKKTGHVNIQLESSKYQLENSKYEDIFEEIMLLYTMTEGIWV